MKKTVLLFAIATLCTFSYARPFFGNQSKDDKFPERDFPREEMPFRPDMKKDTCFHDHQGRMDADMHKMPCPPPPEIIKQQNARAKVAEIRAQSDLMHEIIPIVAIVIIFTAAVIIVFLTLRFNTKKRKAQYELATKIIESGKEIPQGLFEDKKSSQLNEGIFFISFGLGLIPLFWIVIDIAFIWIGVLFILIGIGQIITYYIQKRQDKNNV